MFILYPLYVVGSLVTTLLAFILNPVVMLFVDDKGNLPKCISYFQTFDAPIPKGYFEGLKWLYRNPAYGFDLFIWGIPYDYTEWRVTTDTETTFFAYSDLGAFSFKYEGSKYLPALKFGWKVFWFRHPTERFMLTDGDAKWFDTPHAPICFTIMKS